MAVTLESLLQTKQVRGWGVQEARTRGHPGALRVEGSVGWERLPQIRDQQRQSWAVGIQETQETESVDSVQQDLCVSGASGMALEG